MKSTKVNINNRLKIKSWIGIFQNNNKIYHENIDSFWCKYEYDKQ